MKGEIFRITSASDALIKFISLDFNCYYYRTFIGSIYWFVLGILAGDLNICPTKSFEEKKKEVHLLE